MRYLSVCAGIEAATSAWHHLGWEPVAFSEIEPFPSAVLKHHYPNVPNWGDMTQYKTWPDATIDLLVGGTPCQSFSIAGLRKGLEDPRGNLMLTFLGIADRYRPKYIVWENVPGVLSSNAGRDFGSFLGALGELGYGWAYRVLDAQWFGVAQRRRRVFIVGCLGDQRSAAAVLFESEGVSRNPAPSRKARKGTAANAEASVAPGSADVCGTLGSEMSKQVSNQMLNQPESWFHPVLMRQREGKDGGGKGPLISEEKSLTLATANDQVLAFAADTVTAKWAKGAEALQQGAQTGGNCIPIGMQVRRLTPVECERLQGFPDNFTRIPWKKKPAEDCPDGPRYKALGNSMAVPCMKWIGERIGRQAC
jgi:DNA (cytosine-5)-methyltransferase 1